MRIGFCGTMSVGKTTLVKNLCRQIGVKEMESLLKDARSDIAKLTERAGSGGSSPSGFHKNILDCKAVISLSKISDDRKAYRNWRKSQERS